MAESVVKLRLESGEYDSKIKRAAQNVLAFGDDCQKAGQSVAKADKDTLDYVRSIGQMETVSKNAKGKINEMTTAFTDLSVQYKNLTDEEKKSQFGVALSQSLDQLKNRIGESKAQLTEVNAELGNTSRQSDDTGGVLDALASKFGLNINQAGAFGVALGAATVATKVAKDAFFSNEEQLDEWGRTVASAQSMYRGFLDALNTGDISGYLNRIDTIVSAARQAYDALDNLATFNAFNQVNVARARQAFMDAQNDYREGTGSKEQVKSAGDRVKGELDQRRQLEEKAYSSEIVKIAQERGVNPVDLARVMLGSYGDYNKIKSLPLTGTKTEVKTNMYGMQWRQTTKVAANEMERMGEMLRRFNDTELQHLQGLGAQFFNTGFEKGQIDRQINRIVNGRSGSGSTGGAISTGSGKIGGGGGGRTGGGGGRGGGGGTHQETPEEKAAKLVAAALGNYENAVSTATLRFEMGMDNSEEQQKKLLAAQERLTMAYADAYNITSDEKYKDSFVDAAKEYNKLADVVKGKREEFKKAMESMRGLPVNPSNFDSLLSESMEDFAKRKDINIDTSKMTKGAKEVKEGWQDAARAVQSVGAALQQIENPSAKIAGLIGESIANIALGFAQATASDSKLGVFGWIAAIAGGLGTMISTISAIKSATAGSYAEGGIIPGNNYNDGLVANVSSGELILNRAQQNSIASQLSNNGIGNLQLEAYIDGEDIRLAVRNANRRRGRGEYVTSKTR